MTSKNEIKRSWKNTPQVQEALKEIEWVNDQILGWQRT